MQDAWMVRLVRVHLFEQLCALALSFESLGPLRNSAKDRQPIKQLRFVIRIFGIYGRHGVAVVVIACRFRSAASILVQSGDGSHIELLAVGGMARLQTLLDQRPRRGFIGL